MKPGTFTQLYIQLVFAVKYRRALLHESIQAHVFEYMSGILTNLNHKSIIVNGVEDHVHILFGLNPAVSISDTVHDVKRSSSLHINKEGLCPDKFAWQEGYGAFSYSRSQVKRVYQYILHQKEHHYKQSFKEEYVEFLDKYKVEYDDRFLFNFLDDRSTPTE
jgi:REP element-mobilizing transposase RayT